MSVDFYYGDRYQEEREGMLRREMLERVRRGLMRGQDLSVEFRYGDETPNQERRDMTARMYAARLLLVNHRVETE